MKPYGTPSDPVKDNKHLVSPQTFRVRSDKKRARQQGKKQSKPKQS